MLEFLKVEVDLSGPLPNSVMVELPDDGFPVEIVYENLPPKCSLCGLIGHERMNCRNDSKVEKGARCQGNPSKSIDQSGQNLQKKIVLQDWLVRPKLLRKRKALQT